MRRGALTRWLIFAALVAAIFFGAAHVERASAREVVAFSGYPSGSIVVRTGERRLYYVQGNGSAIRYPVGVGKAGPACGHSPRRSVFALRYSRRLTAQSDGRSGARA